MPFFCIPRGCTGTVKAVDRRQCNLSAVPQELNKYTHSLEELYLDCNRIIEINEAVLNCRSLKVLSLSQNKLRRVPDKINVLSELEELRLDDNELSDLPCELSGCKKLRVLDIRLNIFSRLPSVLTKMDSLTHLNLYDTALGSLPADFHSLSNLHFLDVRENQLKRLPTAIGTLKQLKHFDLGRNELLELPREIGELTELEELAVDGNALSSLPLEILKCSKLQTLDASENELAQLPSDIGDLQDLTELNIAQNLLSELPSSVGRLKKLSILDASNNAITILTPAIASCSALVELKFSSNLIAALPSSIGNLEKLSVLSLDENQITEIPSTIGGCKNLTILKLRSNAIRKLPFEIGRLFKLSVLDLSDNSLAFLPYTISVLSELRALWLSFDQVIPKPPLVPAEEPVTRVKVLTCYLLPQGKCQAEYIRRSSRTLYGVSFGIDDKNEETLESRFQRRGTPHPKTRHRINLPKRMSIDGHYIQHHEENMPSADERRKSDGDLPNDLNGLDQKVRKTILRQKSKSDELEFTKHHITVTRDLKLGFGLSVVGGLDSPQYKEGDSGLFISKVAPGGAAESAGLQVGDKLLFVNGVSVVNEYHQVAVEMMRKLETLELVVQRSKQIVRNCNIIEIAASEGNGRHSVPSSVNTGETVEIISASLKKDSSGSLGLSFGSIKNLTDSGEIDDIVITSIVPNSVADRNGNIRIGDRVLSVNGINLLNHSPEDVESVCSAADCNELFLVLQRKVVSEKDIHRNTSYSLKDVTRTLKEVKPIIDKTRSLDRAFHSLSNSPDMTRQDYFIDFSRLSLNARKRVRRPGPPVPPKPTNLFNASYNIACRHDDTGSPVSLSDIVALASTKEHIEKLRQEQEVENFDSCHEEKCAKGDQAAETVEKPENGINTIPELSLPHVVRTKKAELRVASLSPTISEASTNAAQENTESIIKRQQWRQARFASLEADLRDTELVMKRVENISSRLENLAENENCEERSSARLDPNQPEASLSESKTGAEALQPNIQTPMISTQ